MVAFLHEMFEKDFECIGLFLSAHGFKTTIKKYMKVERGRLKARFVVEKEVCPIHIDPPQWYKLQEY